MAFRQLGINMVMRGAYDVGRAVDRMNLALRAYARVAGQASREALELARNQDRAARAMSREMERSVNASANALNRYSDQVIRAYTSLDKYGTILQSSSVHKERLSQGVKRLTVLERERRGILQLLEQDEFKSNIERARTIGLLGNKERAIANLLIEEGKWHGSMQGSEREAAKVSRTVQSLLQVLAKKGISIKDLKINTEAYAKALEEGKTTNEALEIAMANSAKQTGGLSNTMQVLRAAFLGAISGIQAFMGAMNIVMGIMRTLRNIITTILRPILNLAEAIGRTLVDAFKALIRLPFNILKGFFNSFTDSLRRIFDIVVGTSLSRGLHNLGRGIRDMGRLAFEAAVDFQLVSIRLEALMRREFVDAGYDMADAIAAAGDSAKELVDWVTYLSVTSMFDAEQILDMHALAMAYRFTSDQAKDLTDSILNFATGMGLSSVEMQRIIINFGQLKAQGKIVGNELRDLARGAFVPVNSVLEQMGINLDIISGVKIPSLPLMVENLNKLNKSGKITNTQLEYMLGVLEELSYGSAISADALLKMARSGEWGEEVFKMLGTSIGDLETAASDLTFDKMRTELNKLIETGEITIDEFFWAFMDMVGRDFPNAVAEGSVTMKVALQNMRNFIVEMFGWRVLAPMFDVISRRMTDSLQRLMGDDMRALYANLGDSIQLFTKIFFGWMDAMKVFSIDTSFFKDIISVFTELFAVFSDINEQDALAIEDTLKGLNNVLSQIGIDADGIKRVTDGIRDLFDVFMNLDSLDGEAIWEGIFGALTDIFDPLIAHFAPLVDELIDSIKTQIVDKWNNEIKPALNNFLEEVVLPGLTTFITETIPSWAATIASHIPGITTALGTGLLGALEALAEWAGTNTGENSVFTKLIETLSSLGTFIGMKLGSPSEPGEGAGFRQIDEYMSNKDAFVTSGLAKSLRDLGEAASEALNPLKALLSEFLDPMLVWAEQSDDFISAFDSMVNTFSKLTGASDEMNTLLPALGELVSALFSSDFKPKVTGWNIVESISEIFGYFLTLRDYPFRIIEHVIRLGTEAVRAVREWQEDTSPIVGQDALPVFEILKNSFEAMKEIDTDGVDAIITDLTNIFTSGRGGPLDDLFNNMEEFRNKMQDIGNEPLEKVPFTDMTEQGLGVVDTFIVDVNAIDDSFDKGMFDNWSDLTIEQFQDLSDQLIGHSIIPDMIMAILSYLEETLPSLNDPVKRLMEEIVNTMTSVNFFGIGANLFQGLLNGMQSRFGAIIAYIRWAAAEIKREYEKATDQGSPSKVWEKLGRFTMAGLEKGIITGFDRVMDMSASKMGDIRGIVQPSQAQAISNYDYRSQDNRNISINMQHPSGNFSLDYDYVRAIT